MQIINEEIAQFFLDNQNKAFPKPVAKNIEEALDFLEDCMAQVFDNVKELRKYWDEEGVDVEEMSDDELLESYEVFRLPDGRILLVEA
jgi:hypothetical protein